MPFLLSFVLLAGLFSQTTTERFDLPPLQTVERLDVERYLGRWYEIASIPMFFTRGCADTTATYVKRDDGDIDVVNRCVKNGAPSETTGRLRAADASRGKFKVSFFRPFWSDYWVIDLDANYAWAVVASPGRDAVWILSRTPTLPSDVHAGILERLKLQSIETERLVRTARPQAD